VLTRLFNDRAGAGPAPTSVSKRTDAEAALTNKLLVGGTAALPGTAGLFVDASGNARLGTLTPSAKLEVRSSGVGVLSISAGNHGVRGVTQTTSGADILGNSATGEAVVGRSQGGLGVGAVVGRNDAAGYGVWGFSTSNGIGVFGQAGISSSTGVAGRFENTNSQQCHRRGAGEQRRQWKR
jgi:hypothetical protein